MSVLIFKLRDVSEEEANDIRELLRSNELEYYETTAGRWGIGVAAIWLNHDHERERARELIDDYQYRRVNTIRQQQANLAGGPPTLRQRIREQPLRSVTLLLIALAVLYLSIWPLIKLGR